MQQIMVVMALLLYTAFSFNPIAEISIFSRTFNLSPGDMFTILFVFGILLKALLQNQSDIFFERPPAVNRFLFAYLFLAVVFFLPTLLFFIVHNEMERYLFRSLFNYLLWLIALVLFYYGSDSRLKVKDLKYIVWLLMGIFFGGVVTNIVVSTPGINFINLIIASLSSQSTRLGGQIADPNQLGSLAAFLSVLGIMGVLYEKERKSQVIFFFLTVGTGFVMLLTQSRESMLTLFIAVLCILVFLLRDYQYGKFMVVLAGLMLGSVVIVSSIPRIVETISAIGVGDTGYVLSARDQVWQSALNVVFTYPLGIGFENLTYITNSTAGQAHNAFMQSAVIAGFMGFIAFLIFLVVLFTLLWEQKRIVADNWLLGAYQVFFVGYLVTALGSDHFISFYTFNAIFFGLLGFVVCAR